jgi:carbamoyl-phosphate synthase large subunit
MPFEVNPRFSSTTSLTIEAGIDEIGGLIAQASEGKDESRFEDWEEGIVLVRHTWDEFVDESTFRSSKPVNWKQDVQ